MQPLTSWEGDTASLVLEMKRLAGVRTDSELANFLGLNQSTVSTWKRRGAVPQQVLLTLQIRLLEREKSAIERQPAAIALAIRAAEYLYERQAARGSRNGRWVAYSTVAENFPAVFEAVKARLADLEKQTGRWSLDLAATLFDDDKFLSGLATWIETRSEERQDRVNAFGATDTFGSD